MKQPNLRARSSCSTVRRILARTAVALLLVCFPGAPGSGSVQFLVQGEQGAVASWWFPGKNEGTLYFVAAIKRVIPGENPYTTIAQGKARCGIKNGQPYACTVRSSITKTREDAFSMDPGMEQARLTFRDGRGVTRVTWRGKEFTTPDVSPDHSEKVTAEYVLFGLYLGGAIGRDATPQGVFRGLRMPRETAYRAGLITGAAGDAFVCVGTTPDCKPIR